MDLFFVPFKGNPSFSFPRVPQTRTDSWSVTPFPLHLIEAASSYQATRLPSFNHIGRKDKGAEKLISDVLGYKKKKIGICPIFV